MKRIILVLIVFYMLTASLSSHKAYSKDLKIGLITTSMPVKISSSDDALLINSFTNKLIQKIKKNEYFILNGSNGLISISDKTVKLGSFTGPIKLKPEKKDTLVKCNNHWYRGELIIFITRDKSNITVVNNVDLEDYLLSVVSSEIPNTWGKEALKAQSIAARSYAIGYLGRRKKKGYDLEPTIEDQLYLGVSSEKHSTSEAVKETKGLILFDKDNKPFIALYHSSGGGYTDSIENLWDTNHIKPSTHIQPRPDYDDNSPHFKWLRNYKITNINKLLSNLGIGQITSIVPLSKSISGRVTWLKITGTESDTLIRGEEFRKCLKLPSSKFNFYLGKDELKIAGRGYGHGLGLSQWGAKELAENKFTHDQILAHYYPGTRLVKIPSDY